MLFLFIIALSFSTSSAFATTNTSDTDSSQIKSTTSTSKVTFTRYQIDDASKRVNAFINTNSRLPNYVTMGSKKVTMPQFLQLTSQSIVNINNGKTSPITLKTVNTPSSATETLKNGKIYQPGYVNMAKNILSTINSTGKPPRYVNTALGKMKYQTLILTFSKILTFHKNQGKLPTYISVKPWDSTTNISSTVKAKLDAIGKEEAKYEDVQGISSLASFIKLGYGDCWADSLWLYKKLQSAGILSRIMGYANGGYGVGYRHAWVQINVGNGWVNWNYKGYNSQHFGDVGTGKPCVLIKSGVSNPSIASTGY